MYIPGMRTALSVALAVSFFAFVIAHVGLVAQIARAKRLVRAALALVVPPLAPFEMHSPKPVASSTTSIVPLRPAARLPVASNV